MSDNYLRHCYMSSVLQDKLYFRYLQRGRNYIIITQIGSPTEKLL